VTAGPLPQSDVSYAVVALVPTVDAVDIEAVRRVHDPQFEIIPAHLTLVFPFPSSRPPGQLCDSARWMIDGLHAAEIRLAGVTVHEEHYLFLNIATGRDRLAELHDRLHSGLPDASMTRRTPFVPHVTVARLPSTERAHDLAARLNIDVTTSITQLMICQVRPRVEQLHHIELAASPS
jgi:2'-5' RNA ligase